MSDEAQKFVNDNPALVASMARAIEDGFGRNLSFAAIAKAVLGTMLPTPADRWCLMVAPGFTVSSIVHHRNGTAVITVKKDPAS